MSNLSTTPKANNAAASSNQSPTKPDSMLSKTVAAASHEDAAKAHTIAADNHNAAATATNSPKTAQAHQLASSQHRSAASAHMATAADIRGNTNMGNNNSMSHALAAEGHSINAVRGNADTQKGNAAHYATANATQKSLTIAQGKNTKTTPLVKNKSAQQEANSVKQRQASPEAKTSKSAAGQFRDELKGNHPLQYLWNDAKDSVSHLHLHQQFAHLTRFLKNKGFQTTASDVFHTLGNDKNRPEAADQVAVDFVNRLLNNPNMKDKHNLISDAISLLGGTQGVDSLLENFLQQHGFKGGAPSFNKSMGQEMITKGRSWTGQYDSTQLLFDQRQVQGPSLTITDDKDGLLVNLSGVGLKGVQSKPASENTTQISWPMEGNNTSGNLTFFDATAQDRDSDAMVHNGPMFHGTLTFSGSNPFGVSGTATYQGARTGDSPAKAQPSKVASTDSKAKAST